MVSADNPATTRVGSIRLAGLGKEPVISLARFLKLYQSRNRLRIAGCGKDRLNDIQKSWVSKPLAQVSWAVNIKSLVGEYSGISSN
jgi:hypothetical protein